MSFMMRRRMLMMMDTKESEWLYESVLTDGGYWFGARCPTIIFDVKTGEKYLIEWSNCTETNKYVYDLRKCGGTTYSLINNILGGDIAEESGTKEITIPSDGLLYVGIGSNTSGIHGEIIAAGFSGDYIRIKKI